MKVAHLERNARRSSYLASYRVITQDGAGEIEITVCEVPEDLETNIVDLLQASTRLPNIVETVTFAKLYYKSEIPRSVHSTQNGVYIRRHRSA